MTPNVTTDKAQRRWFRSRRSQQLDAIQELLFRIDAALVVRDPGTARSVDAYDGLRKQVTAAAGDRRRLLVMLSELAEALRLGQDSDQLQSKADEWMLQSGLVRVTDPSAEDAFEFVGADTGEPLVSVPAYVDASSGFIVRRGVAERTDTRTQPDSTPDLEVHVEPINEAPQSPHTQGEPEDGN